ncbi:unnamed protein product [Paramecium octaurelia]|uniref:Uncharacterized protein n=1 Tax=Paramecium octaurelia TaxID=43137 RepID=A0A8S1V0W4_PAROT|nr:unnamed protein product [Paramecium octaurelia]
MITKDDCLRFNCKIAPYILSQQKINLDKASLKNKTALSLAVPNFKCSALFCTDIKTQELCDNTGECAWNNNGACELFSGCGSYQVDKKEDCVLKSTQTKFCTYDEEQQSNGKYNCLNDLSKSGGSFMTCFTLNNENMCNQYEYAVCTWRTFQQCQEESDEVNSCQQYQYCIGEESKDCADLSGFQDKCDKRENYCKWIKDNSTCMEKECSDYTSETDCKSILTDDLKRAKPCTWEEGSCIQGFNLTKLNKYNCLIDSLNTSMWNEVEQRCQSSKQRVNQNKSQKSQDIFCTQIKQKKQIITDEEVEIDPISYEEFDDLKQLRRMIRQTDYSINQYGKEVKQLQNDIKRLTK